jgi:ParB family transcriptional regulator, chromosome partitioning protein
MSTRRKLSDAIASNKELSFVFGQATAKKIAQAAESVREQLMPRESILCTFSFVPDARPVRHYYDLDELQHWASNDIQQNGIRSPLWVRTHPKRTDKYELVAGLRRLKAAEILKLETVPVKVFDWDDRTAFHAAISENVNRRDFSALEELDNMLRLLEIQLKSDTETVVSLLYRMNNAAKGISNQNVLVSHEAELVQQTFDAFGRITWQSFVATRLPLLRKPTEILDGIRQGKIHYTKGIVIASIKDPDIRQQVLTESIGSSLSLAEVKQRTAALRRGTEASSEVGNLKHRLTQTVQQAKKNKTLWTDPDKTHRLEELLKELERIVSS